MAMTTRPVKTIDIFLLIALLSSPLVGIYKGFEGQQSQYEQEQAIAPNEIINSRLALQRARTCLAAVARGSDQMLPTLIGAQWEDRPSDEGQYVCARDGTTGRIIHGTLAQIVTVEENDWDRYTKILESRELITTDNQSNQTEEFTDYDYDQ